MWETHRYRKSFYVFPWHDLVFLSLHTQSRVFQGIVENSFGWTYQGEGKDFSRRSFRSDCGETVGSLFGLHMIYVRILRLSAVSPHERQSRHFHKAYTFPRKACLDSKISCVYTCAFEIGAGGGCRSENHPDLRRTS